MGICIRKCLAKQKPWISGLFILLSLMASLGTQAATESVPGTVMWCNPHEVPSEPNYSGIYYKETPGCTYPTDMAAAQAYATNFNTLPVVVAYMGIDSCTLQSFRSYCYYYYYFGTDPGPHVIPAISGIQIPVALICPTPTVNPSVPYTPIRSDGHSVAGGITCTRQVQYSLTITLSGGNTIEPWHKKWDQDHTSSNSSLPFKATVTNQNNQPMAGMNVFISSDVTPGSGGHAHDNDRPKGRLVSNKTDEGLSTGAASISGQTDGNGQFSFTFGAEEASGEHTLTANCEGCSNAATTNITVGIPGLMKLDADPLSYELRGETDGHPGNHYFSPAAMVKIINLAEAYRIFSRDILKTNELLKINDSSLVHGGTFDVQLDWTSETNVHGGHRIGIVVDINNYHVPDLDFVQLALDKGVKAKWHGKGTAPHYHLVLLNEDH